MLFNADSRQNFTLINGRKTAVKRPLATMSRSDPIRSDPIRSDPMQSGPVRSCPILVLPTALINSK